MPSTSPIPMRWMPHAAYDYIDARLGQAYDWPDYPDPRWGAGTYVDLFYDSAHKVAVGRLWTNDADGCGLLHTANTDPVFYTQTALTLRVMNRNGETARAAFDAMTERWHTGSAFTTRNLADIEDSSIEANVGI
ncbi:hypothetical protein [Mycolicibacterium sp. XJ870]